MRLTAGGKPPCEGERRTQAVVKPSARAKNWRFGVTLPCSGASPKASHTALAKDQGR